MRVVLATFVALLAAACVEAKPGADGDLAGGADSGYTLEIRASEAEQIYLVTAPGGDTVAARASDGVSALMDAVALHAFNAAAPAEEPMDEVMSLRLPGLNLSISGDASGKGEEGGRVSIDIGGHSVEVNADEGGPGEGDDRAHVLIRGVPESEVREFIAKADQLSPAVQAQMLAELGLE